MKISGKPMPSIANSLASSPVAADSKLGRAEGADRKSVKSSLSLDDFAGSAKVDLSDRARDVKRAKSLATPDDSIDEAKVARLQKLIDEGKYKVDADAIADRLLDEQMKMTT